MESLESQLRPKLIDEFSHKVLTGALMIVSGKQNPIRLNLFAAAMRELFAHTLHTLAPDERVRECQWFELEQNTDRPTRRQRAKYATQGGLSDEYIEEIGVDVKHLHDAVISAVDQMNKYTHVRPRTIVDDADEIINFVRKSLSALLGLFKSFDECNSTILNAMSEHIDDAAVDALISETFVEVDELATHHSVEDVYVENTRVVSLTNDTIHFKVMGTVSVELQWGSNSDLRRGDGAVLGQSFPFEVTMGAPIDDPSNFSDVQYTVDTSEWYEDRME